MCRFYHKERGAGSEGCANSHDDEDGDEDGQEAGPGQPRDLLELPRAREDEDGDGGHEHEVVGADGVVGQGVQRRRGPEDAAGSHDRVRHQEEHADDLPQPLAAHDMRHVGDGVAPRVRVAEVPLDYGAVRVQELPSEDVHRPREGPEDVHRGGDRQDTRCEDDYVRI